MDTFPRLVIRRDALVPHGSFAQSQAAFLAPDAAAVAELDALCRDKQIGVVAHFYMDVELQGVLSACTHPHVAIADSLRMADAAVEMAQAGMRSIVVLGVDFMSENVRAVLDAAGFGHVQVYRVASEAIGCSLAESADTPAYAAFLDRAAATPSALHVVYINTSLLTKARAQHTVPTITCTSSNVVQTVLQAAAQVPEVSIFYGPDTYMGANLRTLFAQVATLPEDEIRALHPAHDRRTVLSLLDRFHSFDSGICIVHHLFGDEVAERVRTVHADAFHTAHLEVPGEMFALAAKAQREGRGVVGSTSNILGFILGKVRAALAQDGPSRLSVVLGTEAGMVTSIVKGVQQALVQADRSDVEVEIVFPVASEAVAASPESGLGILPGVASGEGCSPAGGCATCPYMKMNDLDALFTVCEAVGTPAQAKLGRYAPRTYTEDVGGRTAAEVGSEPILHMRHFQQHGELSAELIADIRGRGQVA
ncbi:MAG: quinolinate synthase [Myxococcota bacterium]|jgi:quinolinate synthase